MCAWKSRMGFAIPWSLPDAGPLVRSDIQGVSRLYAECRVSLVDVPDDAVDAIFAEAVRIAGRIALHLLWRRLAGPGLRPAEEDPLVARESGKDGRLPAVQRAMISVERHRQPAEVGDIFAHGQVGIDVHAGHRFELRI